MLRQGSPDPSLPSATVALLGGELTLAEGADETIRRLSLLVEIADSVTRHLSFDHQLPRLIELIAEALDAERATLFLHDADAGELFSRVAGGEGVAEIRIAQNLIGGNVNLAARLESANKYYGTVVLLAESTVDALKAPAVLRRLDLIQAKGMSQPTWVYESLGHHTPATFPRLGALIKAYEAGLDCYQRRDWKAGLALFCEAFELALHDRPSRIFFDRCRYYTANPPAEEWDGVWIMDQK
jgi:hypothetical protein